MRETFRPSHADFTYEAKYGIRNWQGGGRACARETIGRVAAGAIARKVLATLLPEIRDRRLCEADSRDRRGNRSIAVKIEDVEANRSFAVRTRRRKEDDRSDRKDTSRQAIRLVAGLNVSSRNVPAGLGEPVFDKLEADLAKAMLSLPATKGFEIGSGFPRRE